MRILVVEDSRVNRIVLCALLERCGHDVAVAENGAVAVERARSETYELIFMDIEMPELDGLEATRRIRRLNGHAGEVPIIALTAKLGERERCLQAGMDDHMTKPLQPALILDALERVAMIHGMPTTGRMTGLLVLPSSTPA